VHSVSGSHDDRLTNERSEDFLHGMIINRHPAHLEVAASEPEKSSAFEERPRCLAGLHEKTPNPTFACGSLNDTKKLRPRPSPSPFRSAIELIDMTVELQIGVSSNPPSWIDRDPGPSPEACTLSTVFSGWRQTGPTLR
jgi:hypothetical protein